MEAEDVVEASDLEVIAAEAEGAQAEAPAIAADLPVYELSILGTIKAAQRANGLLHSEYERYRQYCTRKVRRVRRSLKFMHGRGKYHKKEVTAEGMKDEKYLLLPLFYAERAWAYAQQAKQEISNRVERGEPAQRRHSMTLLAKADKWTQTLKTLCEARTTGPTALEADAYASWMRGNLLLEKEDWKGAKEAFSRAQGIYVELAKMGSSRDKELYERRLDEIVPVSRLCDHEMKLSGGNATADDAADFNEMIDMQKVEGMDENLRKRLEGMQQDAKRRQAETMEEFEFDGKSISIESEAVRVAVLNVQEASAALDKVDAYDETMEAYDQLFITYNDMMQLVAQQIRALKNDEQVGEMKQLERYVEAKKLQFTMERNEAMAAKLEADLALHQVKPDELLRVYNILAQNAEQLTEYYDDQAGESVKLLEAKGFYFKAHRCAHLAGKYCADKQFPEAVALYVRADGMLQMALNHFEECTTKSSKYTDAATEMQLRIVGVKCAVQAEAFLQDHVSKDQATEPSTNKQLGLLDRLHDWVELEAGTPAQLVEYPPTVQPMACKPIMYDLALNYVKFPDLSKRATAKKQGVLGKASGYLKSFWG